MMDYKNKKEEVKPVTAKIDEEAKKMEIEAKDSASKTDENSAK